MAWIFGLGGNKLEGKVNKIDKDIKKLLGEVENDPFGQDKKKEEYMKLIEKILEEIEDYKKSLHKLYGSRPNDFPELEMIKDLLRYYYEKLEAYKKGHTIRIYPHQLKAWLQSVQTNWNNHKIKFQYK